MKSAEITEAPVNADINSTVSKGRVGLEPATITIRTFLLAESGKGSQRPAGVPCSIGSDALTANIVTPHEVIVPSFKQRARFPNRGLPSALIITCDTGTKRGFAFLTSAEKQAGTATGGGLAAALIILAVSAEAASSSPWIYPNLVNVGLAEK